MCARTVSATAGPPASPSASPSANRLSRVGLRRHCARLACVGVPLLALTGCDDEPRGPYFIAYDVPNSVAIADLNNDGANDLAMAFTHVRGYDPNPGYAGMILQNRTNPGTFQRATTSAVGSNPSIIAVGDLDGTGSPDMAIANALSGDLSIVKQTTTGGLQTSATLGVGGTPYDVAIGDLNHDGLNDLAIADASNRNSVTIVLQSSASPGSYLTGFRVTTPNPTTAVAIGDLNNDGYADLLATSFDSNGNNGQLSVFLQNISSPGSFMTRADFTAGAQPMAVKLADVNNDGLRDAVLANYGPGLDGSGSAGVSVLLQNSSSVGSFLAPVTYATARGAISVAAADLNGDGKADLVVANLGGSPGGTVSVLLQDATRPGVFLTASNYAGIYEPLGVAIGDLNQDGVPDIAVADGERATIMLQSTTTRGTFASAVRVGN